MFDRVAKVSDRSRLPTLVLPSHGEAEGTRQSRFGKSVLTMSVDKVSMQRVSFHVRLTTHSRYALPENSTREYRNRDKIMSGCIGKVGAHHFDRRLPHRPNRGLPYVAW